ncbi:hypothetical protein AB0L64_39825 [Kribbella sp. NPDC051936]|uniref:hypothetical protein n=1 Tax=Kribbella sp. NPDC051936 TaxID=3154946 RepID=UPI00342CCD2E
MRFAVPLTGLLGAALYGVLRLSYVFFYLQLRATPEEVGYGYVEILAGQLIGALELVLFATVVLFVIAVIARLLIHGMRVVSGRRPRRTSKSLSADALTLTLRSLAVALGLVLVGLPIIAWTEGSDAVQGYTVRNVYVASTIRLPVLAVTAVPATVTPRDPDLLRSTDVTDRRCLLYLGRADGQAVFYDVTTHDSLRIPSDSIVIVLHNTLSVPEGC